MRSLSFLVFNNDLARISKPPRYFIADGEKIVGNPRESLAKTGLGVITTEQREL